MMDNILEKHAKYRNKEYIVSGSRELENVSINQLPVVVVKSKWVGLLYKIAASDNISDTKTSFELTLKH